MDLDSLRARATDELWQSDDPTTLWYAYPLPPDPYDPASITRLTTGILPDQLYRVGPFTACTSPQSHLGPFRHAVDFLVPDGTLVLAASYGVVTEIVDWHTKWGNNQDYRDSLNYLTIQTVSPWRYRWPWPLRNLRYSRGTEFTQYCHLSPQSVSARSLAVGSWVRPGQPIGVVGKTGWTDRDHLHFIVFRLDGRSENPYGFISLKPRFNAVATEKK